MTHKAQLHAPHIDTLLRLIRSARATLRLCPPCHDTSVAARRSLEEAERLIRTIRAAEELAALSPPPPLIELRVRIAGRWQLLETFDPAAPQFARAIAPAEYACFVAQQHARQAMKTDPAIEKTRVSRIARTMERSLSS
jgi:hypothetical protein